MEGQDLREFGLHILPLSVILHLFEDVHPMVVIVVMMMVMVMMMAMGVVNRERK
jgi:hypothetical protein